MASSANNIKINPVNVYWQIEAVEQWDFANSTAAGLGGKYVTMQNAAGTDFYAWFDENNTDTDPAVAAHTGIGVDYAASATPAAIATAFASAVGAATGFDATASGTIVTVKRTAVGAVADATVGNATTVLLTICRSGKNFDLGLLQGNIEPSVSPATLDIKAHQYGVTPLATLSQGFDKIECKTVLLETDSSKLKEIYSIYGGSYTPSGGTEVFGAGGSVIGTNILVNAARLVLRPVNALNNESDTVVMLCVPMPESLSFSGENPQVLNVTWKGFLDTSANSKVNAIAFGDVFQAGF